MNTSGVGNLLSSFFSPKPKSKPAEQAPGESPRQTFSFASIPSVVGRKVSPVATETPQSTSMPTPAPTANQKDQSEAFEKRIQELETRLAQKTTEAGRIVELQQQLTQLLTQKQTMEEELVALRKKGDQTSPSPHPTPTRAAGITSSPTSQPTINVIDPNAARKVGIPRLTTFPDVVTGIIKDNMGNLLPGVLVTVRDKNDIPLRALKTNKLGQFAASTQLPPGTYLVEIEDPRGRFVFDRAQIVVNNTILPAIEIVAKSQKEVERARLAQQIFGDQKI
ncbi:carboxypeptidase regulatory-like domain-containing protein [Candidatus Gottesmanbacteria bacterium]|nr:carboxypeptidase regulatory-like domain-containing protein [Candidatus Gottesmanbacteria bacterium]